MQVTNTGKTRANWAVNLTINGTINNLWSANWNQSGATLSANGLDWNKTLAPSAMTEFGFCATATTP